MGTKQKTPLTIEDGFSFAKSRISLLSIKMLLEIFSPCSPNPTGKINMKGDLSGPIYIRKRLSHLCSCLCCLSPLAQLFILILQIKKLTVSGVEHKVVMFAHDVVFHLEEQDNSFHSLITLLKECGSVSGYCKLTF